MVQFVVMLSGKRLSWFRGPWHRFIVHALYVDAATDSLHNGQKSLKLA